MQEALYYEKKEGHNVRCLLCPWYCELKPGQNGVCKVRKNTGGILETLVYNKVAALGIDPIEKKPLYHFYPGKNILSLGLVGCNLHCTFCQNHTISQCRADTFKGFAPFTAPQLVSKAAGITGNIGVAYTYNEPFTFYEFMLETAQQVHAAGMKNVVVSNGYINREPLMNILPFIDAFNIDLKAFDDRFYRHQTKGKLEPVLETIRTIASGSVHLEITNLVIPGLNDEEAQFENLLRWIAGETGKDTPLHISRYFPQYLLNVPPTPPATIKRLYGLAKKYLRYVYTGNFDDDASSHTFCPKCHALLIKRSWYRAIKVEDFNGHCPGCGRKIPIVL